MAECPPSPTPPPSPAPVPLYEARSGTGLLFLLCPVTDAAKIVFVRDMQCPESGKHNACTPAAFEEISAVCGGGSGTAVFRGVHPALGRCIMKHGSHKDAAEIWSLAAVSRELVARAHAAGDGAAAAAAARMRARIPEFRFLYISPRHVMDRGDLLWNILRRNVLNPYASFATRYDTAAKAALGGGRSPTTLTPPAPAMLPPVHDAKGQDQSSPPKRDSMGSMLSYGMRTHSEDAVAAGGGVRLSHEGDSGSSAEADSVTLSPHGSPPDPHRIHPCSSSATLMTDRRESGISAHSDLSHRLLETVSIVRSRVNSCQQATLPCHTVIRVFGRRAAEASVPPTPAPPGSPQETSVTIKPNDAHVDITLGADAELQWEAFEDGDDGIDAAWAGTDGEGNGGKHPVIYIAPNGAGHSRMGRFVRELQRRQREKLWKVTLGQTTVGGARPTTGSEHLVTGGLHGPLLESLLDEFTSVLMDLRALTGEGERAGIAEVRAEVERLEVDPAATAVDVSDATNLFCGAAIRKNFDQSHGRMKLLAQCRNAFRSAQRQRRVRAGGVAQQTDTMVIAPDETTPARYLARLLRRYEPIDRVFVIPEDSPLYFTGPAVVSVFEEPAYWKMLLHQAVGVKAPAALERVWTSGLTDAGLHNLFLVGAEVGAAADAAGEPRAPHMWLFDLGEPVLSSIPGVLTKFLMSFFHVLGMVDVEGGDAWVVRFEECKTPDGTRLRLTPDTTRLLESATTAFRTAVDHFVAHIFENDPAVRALLQRYVVLQLISDAAFCLGRWQMKGGGAERYEGGTEGSISKWLWRALWDIFVASYVHHVFVCKRGGGARVR